MSEKTERVIKTPSVIGALLTSITLIAILLLSVVVFEVEIQLALFICLIIVACYAIFLGYKWQEVEKMMMDGISSILIAVMILLLIGTVIATWIASGTIPYIIYAGLQLISPRFFLVSAFLTCSFMSIATGSSWSSAGTVGIAFMGIGAGLGINPAMTAGAIVSGAYFGDKMSPFSDTTNLSAALSGTTLFEHIGSMLWTTIPASIISIAIYTFMGFTNKTGGTVDPATIDIYLTNLEANFNLSPVLLLPIAILVIVVVKKAPAIPGLVVSALTGAVFAMIFQKTSFIEVGTFMFEGFSIDTGVAQIDTLLNRGGLFNMLWTVSFYFMAAMLGSVLDKTGALRVLLEKLSRVTRSVGSLVTSTLVSVFSMCVFTGSLESGMLITSKLFGPAYDKLNLDRKVLSRSLEDAGTMLAAFIPWNSNGVYMATTLGVATLSYAKYSFLGMTTPIIAIILAFTGIGIFYKKPVDAEGAAANVDGSAAKEIVTAAVEPAE